MGDRELQRRLQTTTRTGQHPHTANAANSHRFGGPPSGESFGGKNRSAPNPAHARDAHAIAAR